jgi:hypothetical protein
MITNHPEDASNQSQQELIRKLKEKEQQRQKIISINLKAAAPVVAELKDAGYQVEWISDLFNKRIKYKDAIPILLRWLPIIENVDVKEELVRALSVPWAKPVAAPVLIAEFHKMHSESNSGIKWAIANALSVVADDSEFEEIVNLVQDPQNGASRKMLALSLSKMKNQHAEDVLINLLDDDEVAGHAIIALGKLKSKKAYPALERFLIHPRSWVRNEAKKAIAKIDKAEK